MLTHTESELLPPLEELLRLEPIFHTRDFGLTRQDRETRMAPDYWEIGASGRRYSREFILRHVDSTHFVDANEAGWQTSDHEVLRLAPDTCLFTYSLLQGDRLTRRATIWKLTPAGWTILFHQGTVVATPNVKE